MNRLKVAIDRRHILHHTCVVRDGLRSQVLSYGTILSKRGENSFGSNVVVSVYFTMRIPEDKEVLFHDSVLVGPLDVNCKFVVHNRRLRLASPIDQDSKVLEPLAITSIDRVGAEHDIWPIGAIKDTSIMWPDAQTKIVEIAKAFVTKSGSDG